MSIKYMSKVWENSEHSGNTLLLLLALADHANDDGICWPSIPKLAAKARMSTRQTQRLIKQLEESGEIEILSKGDGRGHSTMYRIKDDKLSPIKAQNKGDEMSTFGKECQNQKGDISGQKGDKSARKGDIAMSPEPSIEPSVESSNEGGVPDLVTAEDAGTSNPTRHPNFRGKLDDPRNRLEDPPTGPSAAALAQSQKNKPKHRVGRKKQDSPHFDKSKFVNGRIPPDTGATPVEVFYERNSFYDACLNAILEDDLAREVKNLDTWRAVVIDWQRRGYNPNNIGGQLDWYHKRMNGAGPQSTGQPSVIDLPPEWIMRQEDRYVPA